MERDVDRGGGEYCKDSAGRFLLAIRTSFSDETSEIGPGGVRSPVEKRDVD